MKALWMGILSIGLISGAPFLPDKVNAGEKYPNKPITLIMPLEAGSDGDINLRPLMEKASELMGKPIIVVNKPGAAQTIGYREINKAKPDGYTLGIGLLTLVTTKLQGLAPPRPS
jgi:tripartite-type tricarboxylate transporter receptor subunit TctC